MRWKYVIPALVIVILISVFSLFFMDSLLRWAMVSAGEMAFGAKVEVAGLQTKLSQLSITITGLQVADKDAPMKNLLEVDSLRFGVQPIPLLSKKVIIETMSATGVRWATARKTSGVLPSKKTEKVTKRWKAVDSTVDRLSGAVSEQGKNKIAALPAVAAIKAVQEQIQGATVEGKVKPENLPMLKELDAMKAGYQKKADDYKNRLYQLQVQEKLQALGPAWNEVSSLKIKNPQDVLAAKEKFDQLNKALQELQSTADTLKALKKEVEAEFGAQQALLDKIHALKGRDLMNVGTLLKLPTFDFSSLTSALLGPLWTGRLTKALELTAKARTYMPPAQPKGKKAKPPLQPRMRGMDVRFPAHDRPPDFWIKRMALAGSTGGPGKPGEPIDFTGTITDITSDPALLGRPLKVDLTGTQGARHLVVEAVLDHTGEIPSDRFKVAMSGLRPEELNFPSSDYLPDFKKGSATMTAGFGLTGDELEARLELNVTSLSTGGQVQPISLDSVSNLAPALWQGVDRLEVGALAKGSADNLSFTITSNIDKILGDRMQALIGGQLADLQKKLRAEVDQLVAGKQSELLHSYAGNKDSVLSPMAQQTKSVTDKIAEGRKMIEDKQADGNKLVDQQKQQAQEQLQQGLKNLFGK